MKVTADDLSINVRRYSDPPRGAVPVTYVHGATFPAALAVGWGFADGLSWADDLIDAGFDVWGFDFAGYGQSTRYPQMRTAPAPRPLGRSSVAVRQLAAVVDRVRTETAQPRVVLLAHSWGSIVAARLAAEQPLLVERLLLFGPILRREGGDASAVDQLPGWDLITPEAQLERFREDVPAGEAELITDAMFAPWAASYLLSDRGAAARTPPAVGVPNGPVADILAARAGSLPYDPAEIRCPVAIVRGAWDSRVTDADVAKFKASLVNCPGFTDAKLERGTHLMHLETGRGRLWTATRNALAEAKQQPIDTHAVIFEVEPSEQGRPEYLATAASLRPLLDEMDGFISIERFQSKKQPGRVLSLSFWVDEAAIAAWRSRERHHSAQEKGRAGIFKDYQIRVAHVLFDDHFGQARQPRHESAYNDPARRTIKYLGILEITGEPRSMNQFPPKRRGVRRVETFASLTNPNKLLHLVDFATAGAAREWSREASAGSRRAAQSGLACRVRTLEVLRDYGMFDRAHAPQYLPPGKGDGIGGMSLPDHEIGPNFADLAALIGDPARAAILWSLMGGDCRPAGELARIAGLSPQAASTHLTRLVDGGLLRVEPKGRHRFFRLSGPEAASAIENLAAVATVLRKDARIVSLVSKPLREARRCWAHLAGECGVRLHDAFIARGWVIATNSGYALADAGRLAVVDLGVHLSALKAGRRGFLFDCLDWSERRPHFAGPLASALLTVMIDAGWFTEVPGSRQLMITPTGHQKLRKLCEDELSVRV